MSNSEIDIDQVMLDLLTHEGFLVKQKTKSGKIWYKRTDKQIPKIKDVCEPCMNECYVKKWYGEPRNERSHR